MTALLDVSGVSFSYGSRQALSEASFRLEPGESLCLLGPNGCGKTTLSKIALGLLKPQGGRVLLGGEDIAKMSRASIARRVSYVPQRSPGGVSYSVFEMTLMGRLPYSGCYGSYSSRDRAAAWSAIERIGIADLAEARFDELSGGQERLALIARALAQEAGLCVMDEPESGLDYGNQLKLFSWISELSASGLSFLITTHNPDHALWTGGRALMLSSEGRVISSGLASECVEPGKLKELYGADVYVGSHAGRLFCLPRFERLNHKKGSPHENEQEI